MLSCSRDEEVKIMVLSSVARAVARGCGVLARALLHLSPIARASLCLRGSRPCLICPPSFLLESASARRRGFEHAAAQEIGAGARARGRKPKKNSSRGDALARLAMLWSLLNRKVSLHGIAVPDSLGTRVVRKRDDELEALRVSWARVFQEAPIREQVAALFQKAAT